MIKVVKGTAALDTDIDSQPTVTSISVEDSARVQQVVCKGTLRSTTIMVMMGDITEYVCDGIINATNVELEHEDGVAKAIVDKGMTIVYRISRVHIVNIKHHILM